MKFNEKIICEGLAQVLVIAKERVDILERLKRALLEGDDQQIQYYASQICGLTNEGDRISESINTGTG